MDVLTTSAAAAAAEAEAITAAAAAAAAAAVTTATASGHGRAAAPPAVAAAGQGQGEGQEEQQGLVEDLLRPRDALLVLGKGLGLVRVLAAALLRLAEAARERGGMVCVLKGERLFAAVREVMARMEPKLQSEALPCEITSETPGPERRQYYRAAALAHQQRLRREEELRQQQDQQADSTPQHSQPLQQQPQRQQQDKTSRKRQRPREESPPPPPNCFFVTERILLNDLLQGTCDARLVAGMIVVDAHRVDEDSLIEFIIHLYRQKNASGFVKALSEDAAAVMTGGLGDIERLLKGLSLRRLALWPRHRPRVVGALARAQHESSVAEIKCHQTPHMSNAQQALLVAMAEVLGDLRKQLSGYLDIAQLQLDRALLRSFDRTIQKQLRPYTNKLSWQTRQLLGDISTLRTILSYLLRYDPVSFYTLLCDLRSSITQKSIPSAWLGTEAAKRLYEHARDRLYTVLSTNAASSGCGKTRPTANSTASASTTTATAAAEATPRTLVPESPEMMAIHRRSVKHLLQMDAIQLDVNVEVPPKWRAVCDALREARSALRASPHSAGPLAARSGVPIVIIVRELRTAVQVRSVLTDDGGADTVMRKCFNRFLVDHNNRIRKAAARRRPADIVREIERRQHRRMVRTEIGNAGIPKVFAATANAAAEAVAASLGLDIGGSAKQQQLPQRKTQPPSVRVTTVEADEAVALTACGLTVAELRRLGEHDRLLLQLELSMHNVLNPLNERAPTQIADLSVPPARARMRGRSHLATAGARGTKSEIEAEQEQAEEDEREKADEDQAAGGEQAREAGQPAGDSHAEKRMIAERRGADASEVDEDFDEVSVAILCLEKDIVDPLETLCELQPAQVILYDPDVACIRALEVYHCLRPLSSPAVHVQFLLYENTAEEQDFNSTLHRERDAFDTLINLMDKITIAPRTAARTSTDTSGSSSSNNNNSSDSSGESAIGDVVVDLREFRSAFPFLLYKKGVGVVPRTLTVGDYVTSSFVCIERKSLSDLISSLGSGRLYTQMKEMSKHYRDPCLLIEFAQDEPFSVSQRSTMTEQVQIAHVTSKLAILCMHCPNMRILWSRDPHNSVDIVLELKKRGRHVDVEEAVRIGNNNLELADSHAPYLGDGEFNHDVVADNGDNVQGARASGGATTTAGDGSGDVIEYQENRRAIDALLRIPGITENNFRNVMQVAESIAALSTMTVDELRTVVGPTNAAAIVSFFTRPTDVPPDDQNTFGYR